MTERLECSPAIMPHSTNRTAFLSCSASDPLLRLYTLLIALELTLKDHIGLFSDGHDLDALVQRMVPPPAGDLQAALGTFERSLGKLRCTSKGGGGVLVNSKVYPGIRYLRFVKDGFTDGSPDADVEQTLADANQLMVELRRVGVSL
jgi:hypothetical protein